MTIWQMQYFATRVFRPNSLIRKIDYLINHLINNLYLLSFDAIDLPVQNMTFFSNSPAPFLDLSLGIGRFSKETHFDCK